MAPSRCAQDVTGWRGAHRGCVRPSGSLTRTRCCTRAVSYLLLGLRGAYVTVGCGGLRWAYVSVGCGGLIFRWAAVRVGLSSGVGDRTRGVAPEGSQGCIGCRALGELGPWSGLPRAACTGLQCVVLGVSRIRLHGRRRSRVRKGAVLSRGVRCVTPAARAIIARVL